MEFPPAGVVVLQKASAPVFTEGGPGAGDGIAVADVAGGDEGLL